MKYETKINAVIADHLDGYDPRNSDEREELIDLIKDQALQGDDILYRQLDDYTEHALDLAAQILDSQED